MQLIDEKIAELERIDVARTKLPDFDDFWAEAMDRVRKAPLQVRSNRIDYPIRNLTVHDLTYEGLDGTEVHGWLLLPREAQDVEVPVVVCYHGASGSREHPSTYAQWTAMGCAVIAVDARLQGGTTGSFSGFAAGTSAGWLSLGVTDPRSSYLYHLWTDWLRAVNLALQTPEIDSTRIAVNGGSQGGGASLALAALRPDDIALCMADVPSGCWYEKRLFDRSGGVAQVAGYLQRHPDAIDRVCDTLSYFDNINLADRIRCPILVSAGMRDPVCPVENVFAAYNKIASEKDIVVYPFGEHDGGGAYHNERKLAFVHRHFLSE